MTSPREEDARVNIEKNSEKEIEPAKDDFEMLGEKPMALRVKIVN